jgi:YVTN family beta-propeller protein
VKRPSSWLAIAAIPNLVFCQRADASDPRNTVFVVNRDSSDIAMIDLRTDRVVGRIALGELVEPHMAMVTPDGKRLVVAGTGRNEVILVDLATLGLEARIPVGAGPEHLDVSEDSRTALVGNLADGTVSVLDLERGVERQRVTGFVQPHGLVFVPGQHKAYVSSFGAHEVATLHLAAQVRVGRRLPVGSGSLVASLGRFWRGSRGVVHPTPTLDGRYVYAADGDSGQVAVIDTVTDEVVRTLRVGKEPWRAYPSPDGRMMVVPNNGDQTVSILDARRHSLLTTLPAGPGMTGVNFSGHEAYVFSTGETATILVYDLESLALAARLVLGAGIRLETGSTTPDGARIYVASSADDSVYVVHTATHRIERIGNVGTSPWATALVGAYAYCH